MRVTAKSPVYDAVEWRPNSSGTNQHPWPASFNPWLQSFRPYKVTNHNEWWVEVPNGHGALSDSAGPGYWIILLDSEKGHFLAVDQEEMLKQFQGLNE